MMMHPRRSIARTLLLSLRSFPVAIGGEKERPDRRTILCKALLDDRAGICLGRVERCVGDSPRLRAEPTVRLKDQRLVTAARLATRAPSRRSAGTLRSSPRGGPGRPSGSENAVR